jgi:hypothetical protein
MSSCPPVDLAALEVGVFASVGHCREYLGERAAPGAQQRLLEDFPMLLFGAVIASGGAPLELPYDGFVDVADDELGHIPITLPLLAMLAGDWRPGQTPDDAGEADGLRVSESFVDPNMSDRTEFVRADVRKVGGL